MKFKNIEWDEGGRLTLPRGAGRTALHVLSLLDGELCHVQEDMEDVPSIPRAEAERVLDAFFAMQPISELADSWFRALEAKPIGDLAVPPGHPRFPGDDSDLIVLGIGKANGARDALLRDIRAVKILYEKYCELSDDLLPPTLRDVTAGFLFGCIGLYFIDLMVEDRFAFHDIHLVHACECLAIASLNRVGDEAVSAFSNKRRAAASLRWKRDPTQAAKDDAKALWPEASRKGWTAERLWTALRDKGHDVKADTVRKWVTSLRKNGMC